MAMEFLVIEGNPFHRQVTPAPDSRIFVYMALFSFAYSRRRLTFSALELAPLSLNAIERRTS